MCMCLCVCLYAVCVCLCSVCVCSVCVRERERRTHVYGGNLSGLSSQTPMSVGEKKCHEWTEAMRASESVQSRVQFVFSFSTLKPKGRGGKQASFHKSLCRRQQVVKGSHPLSQLFL